MSKLVEEPYDDTFAAVLAQHYLAFVDFYADGCGPCKALAPVIERTAKTYAGRIFFRQAAHRWQMNRCRSWRK